MRLRHAAGLAGLGALVVFAGCAKGLPTARRFSFANTDGLIAGPRPQRTGPDGLIAGPRPKSMASDGLMAGPRVESSLGSDGLVGAPHGTPDPRRERVAISGPDRVTLLDGTPLLGELAFADPYTVRLADGLTMPRIIVGAIELGDTREVPALGAHPLHDVVALHNGEWMEGAVVSVNAERVRLAVFGPDMMSRGTQVIPRQDVAAIALRDRRDAPCARAALVLADAGEPGRLVAEVSNLSLDEVHVYWLAQPGTTQGDKLLRCYEREGASSCQVASWLGQSTECPSTIGGLEVHALRDDVGHLSESRRFGYALRDGEQTLAASAVLQRDRRHAHGIRPARINTPYRGEAHYWDTSWRDRKDDGLHAVQK